MKKLLLILLCLPFIGFGQNVYIPDANFKAYLVGNTAINTNGDGEIQLSEASIYSECICCDNMNIYDLTGLEAFISITALDCEENQISDIDISLNVNLTALNCSDNPLNFLDISNSSITHLDCEDTPISSLNLTNATDLETLECANNKLVCLDISTNNNLEDIYFDNNLLEQLNMKNGQWTKIDDISGLNNNLTCVEVDNLGYANSNWTSSFDSFVTFSTNCNYANPCNSTTAIQEYTTNKELLKVTDLLGRETKGTKNEALFYIYDDGTVEKRITID